MESPHHSLPNAGYPLPQRGIVPFVTLFHPFLEAETLFLRPNALAHLLQDVHSYLLDSLHSLGCEKLFIIN